MKNILFKMIETGRSLFPGTKNGVPCQTI